MISTYIIAAAGTIWGFHLVWELETISKIAGSNVAVSGAF